MLAANVMPCLMRRLPCLLFGEVRSAPRLSFRPVLRPASFYISRFPCSLIRRSPSLGLMGSPCSGLQFESTANFLLLALKRFRVPRLGPIQWLSAALPSHGMLLIDFAH